MTMSKLDFTRKEREKLNYNSRDWSVETRKVTHSERCNRSTPLNNNVDDRRGPRNGHGQHPRLVCWHLLRPEPIPQQDLLRPLRLQDAA